MSIVSVYWTDENSHWRFTVCWLSLCCCQSFVVYMYMYVYVSICLTRNWELIHVGLGKLKEIHYLFSRRFVYITRHIKRHPSERGEREIIVENARICRNYHRGAALTGCLAQITGDLLILFPYIRTNLFARLFLWQIFSFYYNGGRKSSTELANGGGRDEETE